MSSWSVRGRHLPALDGLRAFAVLAVLAYHLGFGWARGGYLGVDLFFVLSGFLITSLLLEEHEDNGTIQLAKFWGRRARRLLPALFCMVTLVMVYVVVEGRYGQTAFAAAFDLHALRLQAIATLLYVANWQDIISQHSYFAQFSAPNPLQHTWSLSIEEQFYLLWPFVTLGLLAKGLRDRRRLGISVSVAIALASTALMAAMFESGVDLSRIYYGTDTRLADLAVGTVLAWLTARRPETPPRVAGLLRIGAPLALAGLVALMVFAGSTVPGADATPSSFMFQGGFLLASLLSVIVIADVRRADSVIAKGFSWRPVVAIGLVSYGVYLWHWPVIVLFTGARTGLSGAPLLIGRLALIAALVVASYFLIELPVRRRWLPRRARMVVYPCGVAITVAAVFIGTTPSLVIKSYVRASLLRYAPASVIIGAGGLGDQVPIPPPHAIDKQHPLRVVLVGDSQFLLSGAGIVAALDATGEVKAFNRGFDGFGTTRPHWRGYLRHAVRSTHANLVLFTTAWDGKLARDDPAAYRERLKEVVAIARAAGATGVAFVQYPKTHPLLDLTPQALETDVQKVAAWNAVAAEMPAQLPGEAMYFPVAAGVELNGEYSPWIPPPRDPNAPRTTWDRVRRVDGVHLCPPGIELYAAPIAADVASVWHLPEPAGRWWINGWQRSYFIVQGAQYCPADHPPG
ncbi:MAG TPA: acyltransferase family protein [Acidimicrobiales bacterium]